MELADFLEPMDRDGLLGDLAEAGASRREIFFQVLWLLTRRHGFAWLFFFVFGCYSAWQFFNACNDAHFPQGHTPWWFALGCFSFACMSFMMARALWAAGRAIWLNAILGGAVELAATLYLNLFLSHGGIVSSLLRMALAFMLGPSVLLITAVWRGKGGGAGRRVS